VADFEDRLRAAVTSQADGFSPSGDLPDKIRGRVAERRRQQRLLAGGLAAGVATAALLVGVLVVDPPSEGDRVETADPPTTSTTSDRAPTTVAEGTTTTGGASDGTTSTSSGGTTGTTESSSGGNGGPGTTEDGGGSPTSSGTATTTAPPTTTGSALRPPDSESPAAGTCGELTGAVVEITINPDIPSPRCVRVRPDQSLRVVNASGQTVEISFAGRSATLAGGASEAYPQPFGDYLAPGVHRVTASLYGESGAEVWLVP
jgi:hypothetical protein